jgi:hypothetical protein
VTSAAPRTDWPGRAFLAIGNTVLPEMRDAYEGWHGQEHVPERLTMPGFLAAKRYICARGTESLYLTLYEIAGPEALETPEYLHLLANPTPASRRMRPAMGDFSRHVYRETGRAGQGFGCHLGMIRWPESAGQAAAPSVALGAVGAEGVLFARMGRSLPARPHPAFPAAAEASAGHEIVLLSGTDRKAIATRLPDASSLAASPQPLLECALYALIAAY